MVQLRARMEHSQTEGANTYPTASTKYGIVTLALTEVLRVMLADDLLLD